jgi:hypothetical protein
VRRAIFAFLLLAGSTYAQDALHKQFTVNSDAEIVLSLTATAPGADWGKEGAEAPLCDVSIDGKLNQNIVIFRGEKRWIYKVFLGRFTPGKHELEVRRDPPWSAPRAGLKLESAHLAELSSSDPDHIAIVHAPILMARADTIGRYSDLPLLMWYEELPVSNGKLLQYSIVFTNEDGGTATDALMARWGRTTDIEYIYRVQLDSAGKILKETFQAPDHKDQQFHGEKIGEHPLLLDATLNNVFSDAGHTQVQYRLLPFKFDLSDGSRERVMDMNPWTYYLSAQEMKKEGKTREYGAEAGANSKISDPRNYVYLELNSDNKGCGLVAWAKLEGDPMWYSSHRGRLDFSITRSGWARTAIELPPGTDPKKIEQVALECLDLRDPRTYENTSRPSAGITKAFRGFTLSSEYVPATLFERPMDVILNSGEKRTAYSQK